MREDRNRVWDCRWTGRRVGVRGRRERRSEQRRRRVVRPLDTRRRRRHDDRRSPARTSPAASTPATRERCAAPARWPPQAGVAVGAQVGYRDLAGFGRRFIDIDPAELTDDVIYQIGALQALAAVGRHLRAATSSRTARSTTPSCTTGAQARAVVEAVRAVDPIACRCSACPVRCCWRSPTRPGCARVPEAFADRGYTAEGTLVPRCEPGALLHDPDEVAARMVRLVTDGVITAVDGPDVRVGGREHLRARGQPGAVAMAARVRAALRGRRHRRCGPSHDRAGCCRPATAPAAARPPISDRHARARQALLAARARLPEVEDLVPAATPCWSASRPASTSPSSVPG